MNKIVIVGRLSKEPEISKTSNGVELCRFNIACRSKTKDGNGDSKTDFFVCMAWREKAKLISSYCSKGDQVQVCGFMSSRNYEKDGVSKQLWEVTVEDVEFLTSKNEKSTQNKQNNNDLAITEDDDCPF